MVFGRGEGEEKGWWGERAQLPEDRDGTICAVAHRDDHVVTEVGGGDGASIPKA